MSSACSPLIAEADEGEVRVLALGRGGDLGHLELPRDHLVTETRHDLRDPSKAIFPLVRDQDPKRAAQFLGFRLAEKHDVGEHDPDNVSKHAAPQL